MFQLKLFPNFCKKISLVILLLNILFVFLTKSNVLSIDLEFSKTLFSMVLILSAFIWIFSGLKIENEHTSHIRFQAFIVSFVFMVITFFFEPVVGIMFEGNISGFKFESSAFSLVSKALAYYIFFFNVLLRKLKKEK